MYAEWFGKRSVLEYRRSLVANPEPNPDAVSEFLAHHGYRTITHTDDGVTAIRGRKAWNLINVGDPRRLYHSTRVTLSPGTVGVRTEIDTWFGLGTKHDAAVLEAEVEMLSQLLETGVTDEGILRAAQARRQGSDLLTCVVLLGLGIVMGVATVVALLLFVALV